MKFWLRCCGLLMGLLVGLVLLVGCGEGNKGPFPTLLFSSPGGAAQVIGYDTAIPAGAGALSVTALTQSLAAGLAPLPAGRVFLAGAQGSRNITFSHPVSLTVKLAVPQTPGEKLPVFTLNGNAWSDTGAFAVTSSDGTLASVDITHFSSYAIFDTVFTVQAGSGFSFAGPCQVTGAPNDFSYASGVLTWNQALAKSTTSNYDSITQATAGNYATGSIPVQAGAVLLVQLMQNQGQQIAYLKMKVVSADANMLVFLFQPIAAVGVTHVAVSAVISGATAAVSASDRLAWAPDGTLLAFRGTAGQVYKVNAADGATPTLAVLPADPAAQNGIATPNLLTGNVVAFATGWYATDHNLHIMTVPASFAAPTAQLLHSYNASAVGLAQDALALPTQLCLSASGARGIGAWAPVAQNAGGVYLLDWGGGQLQSQLLAGYNQLTSLAISPDGLRVVYSKTDGNLYWRTFMGQSETLIGPGYWPSWSADSAQLGYANAAAATTYTVMQMAGGAKTTYTVPPSITCQLPALSPDGHAIAFRTLCPDGTQGLEIGALQGQ